MYHPTTRLLTVLELLQTHGQMSAAEIAARLEIDPRTVRRYILMLQDIGIPIEAEMGRHGGYTLRAGFKLPPMMFTNDEAFALILGLLVARHLGLAAASCSVEGAMAKLQRVLPDDLREQTQTMQSALTLNIPSPNHRVAGALLAALGQAVHEQTQVILTYHKESEQTRRTVDPYGLVYHDGTWYLVGYCHLRAAVRIFRLDRIAQMERRRETFSVPPDFDSLGYLLESFAVIPDRWDIEVLLKTTLEDAQRDIPQGMGVLEAQSNGVIFRTSVTDLDFMARFLVGLGCPLVVCQPSELRTAFENLAARILQFAASTAIDS
jgi:predicted DNA-binding transcriptional regulator YafY